MFDTTTEQLHGYCTRVFIWCWCCLVCRGIVKEMGLTGKITPDQVAKKWDNLKTKFKVTNLQFPTVRVVLRWEEVDHMTCLDVFTACEQLQWKEFKVCCYRSVKCFSLFCIQFSWNNFLIVTEHRNAPGSCDHHMFKVPPLRNMFVLVPSGCIPCSRWPLDLFVQLNL